MPCRYAKHISYESHLRETSSLSPPSQLLRKRKSNLSIITFPQQTLTGVTPPQPPRKGNREINQRTRLRSLRVFALPAKVCQFQGGIFLASNGSESPAPPQALQAGRKDFRAVGTYLQASRGAGSSPKLAVPGLGDRRWRCGVWRPFVDRCMGPSLSEALPAVYWTFIRSPRNIVRHLQAVKTPYMCEALRKLTAPPWGCIFREDVYYR